ncbi:MAG: hypothetical protein ACRC8Y_08655 [Chroococcales cyanobacterium]
MAIGIIDKIKKIVIVSGGSEVAGTEGPILGAIASSENPEVPQGRSMILGINPGDTS